MSVHHRHYSGQKKSRASRVAPRSILYLVRAADGDVKVGVTNDIKRRLYELGRGPRGPVELLHHRDGGTQAETTVRRALAAHHVGGDWFRGCEAAALRLVSRVHAGPKGPAPRRPDEELQKENERLRRRVADLEGKLLDALTALADARR